MALKFPRDVTQFRGLSRDEAGISRGIGERFCANSSCQLIKKWDISRGASDKIMRNFHGFWFWPWNDEGVLHNFEEFPGVKPCFF